VIDARDLARLEASVTHALDTGDERVLDVLGYGEITLVLAWPPGEHRWACKRLPPFPDVGAFDAYRRVFDDYLQSLRSQGIDVVDTHLGTVARDDGTLAAYCVQPALPHDVLVPSLLRRRDAGRIHPVFEAVADAVVRVTSPSVGLDAQLSNWAWCDGTLRYFDVTTPMLLDASGQPLLDTGLFLAALPWALRATVRRFVLPGVFARFTNPRAVCVDLLGNMLKERLDVWLPHALAAVNERVDLPVSETEVRKFYAADARLWRAMLAVRRADRWWQRRVRHRPYPFLLPAHVER
jgi:hypothetical protein